MTSLTENIDHFLEPVNSATVASLPYAHGDLPQSAQTLDQYLDAVEERWNQRIDREVKTLGDGLEKMLDHLDNGLTTSQHRAELSSLSLSTQTSSLVLAAERLLSVTHQLKLMVLLSDDQGVRGKLEAEEEEVDREITKLRKEVEGRLKEKQ